MNITGIIEYLYPEAINLKNYKLQDDGDGLYISAWKLKEPKPTKEYILSKKSEYDIIVNQRRNERKQRKLALAQKLNIGTIDELRAIKELIEDGNLD